MRKDKIKTKLTFGDATWKVVKTILHFILIVFALSFAAALIWVFLNSFKTATDYMEHPFGLWKEFDFANYQQVLDNLQYKGYGIFGMLGNTMILVLWNIFVTLTLPNMAAYVLARFDFMGKKVLQFVIYLSIMIPVIGTSNSTMWFLNSTGLFDNFLGIFLLSASAFGVNQIMLTAVYKGVAPAYAEAAYMDGASEWKVFWHIYYPQAKGMNMLFVIRTFIGVWNDYMTGYLYLPSHPTLALGLQQMQAQFVDYGNDVPVMFAGVVLSMIPILILYLRFADNILTGTVIGSLK